METIAPARSGHPRALLPVLLAAPFLAQVAALAAAGAYLATHVSDDGGRRTGTAKPRRSGDLMTAASQGSKS